MPWWHCHSEMAAQAYLQGNICIRVASALRHARAALRHAVCPQTCQSCGRLPSDMAELPSDTPSALRHARAAARHCIIPYEVRCSIWRRWVLPVKMFDVLSLQPSWLFRLDDITLQQPWCTRDRVRMLQMVLGFLLDTTQLSFECSMQSMLSVECKHCMASDLVCRTVSSICCFTGRPVKPAIVS